MMTALERALADATAAGIVQQKIEVGDLCVNVARFGRYCSCMGGRNSGWRGARS